VGALDGAFLGGARTPADLPKAEARFEVLRVFHSMGPKARTNEMMLALVRLQRGDPSPAVRQAARLARARMQEE
jgi:hypothetical protein